MSNSRAEAAAAMDAAPKRFIRIDNTLHVIIGEDTGGGEAQKLIERALKRGKTVTESGVSRWWQWFDVIVPDHTGGSSAYIWNGGDRVKSELMLMVKSADGTVTRTKIRTGWRSIADE